MQQDVYLSVVVPIYNEQECLETLYKRLTNVLDKMDKTWEVIFTNDGSRDRSSAILKSMHERRPQQIRVIEFNGNFGQHMAIMAAFERVRGQVIINLDADLQNPPEEIPRLLEKYEEGYDYVGTIRRRRNDSFIRDIPSKIANYFRGKMTNIHITDQGCMMRAYSRHIVDHIVQCRESSTFVTALGYSFSSNPTEIKIEHCAREEGDSKYGFTKLIGVAFDLFTGFSMTPIHFIIIVGITGSILSGLWFAYWMINELILGSSAQDYTFSFAILYFLISFAIAAVGMIGEYVGRTYAVVRDRPRFIIREILEDTENVTQFKKVETK